MLFSDILPITGVSAQVALCGVGQELTVFGLVFVNSNVAMRTVTMTLYRQSMATTRTIPIEIQGKEKMAWDKPIVLQPGDYLNVVADLSGVNLLWSVDSDTGANPVASGFVVRGTHSNVTAYSALDVVLKSGSSYVAIQNNTNQDPITQTAYWMLLVDGAAAVGAIAAIVGGAPANLDTLNELAAAIGNDPIFSTTMAAALAQKAATASLSAAAFTGEYADAVDVKKYAARALFQNKDFF